MTEKRRSKRRNPEETVAEDEEEKTSEQAKADREHDDPRELDRKDNGQEHKMTEEEKNSAGKEESPRYGGS